MALANDAAPYLGVGVRLLTQLESGSRGKRGVTIGKLLDVLGGLGLELVVQPRTIDRTLTSQRLAEAATGGTSVPPTGDSAQSPAKHGLRVDRAKPKKSAKAGKPRNERAS